MITPALRVTVVALALLVLVAACGGSSGGAIQAPSNPGDAASLAGTSWMNPEGTAGYAFAPGGRAEMHIQGLPQATPGSYSVNNGVVVIDVGVQSIEGTWDGQNLVLEGQRYTRR